MACEKVMWRRQGRGHLAGTKSVIPPSGLENSLRFGYAVVVWLDNCVAVVRRMRRRLLRVCSRCDKAATGAATAVISASATTT